MKITAPYNFVPLNQYVFYPSWSEEVSQDIPFSDSEDGIIEVTVHTLSPFFSRDGKETEYSSHIMGADGKRHYFIPATTIKGMLRSMIEIMSFGKMQEGKDYQNRYFGWRDVANSKNAAKSTEYKKITNKGKPGWLKKVGDAYTFTPCMDKIKNMQISDVKGRFPGYTPNTSVWDVNASVEKSGIYPTYPEVEIEGASYRLVCTGDIGGKKHELLFPMELGEEEMLSDETIAAFKTLYENTPGFAEEKVTGKGCFLKALEEGKEIPVFKIVRDDKTFLGFSKMFRIPFRYNVRDQVEFIQKPDKEKADLAEILFGYAGKEKSLKGRVMVGHAFMDGFVDDHDLKPVSGILGSPKASYYPFYIKQHQSPYKTYDDPVGVAGRKLYRIHKGNTTMGLPQGDNKNMDTTFNAIPEGQTFRLRIALHNTRPMEIGAVLAALTLNGTDGTSFNLGLAKGFGYGKCKVNMDEIKLSGFGHDVRYYMHEFEKEMSIFAYETSRTQWAKNESIITQINIFSEHDDATVKMMELDEYGEGEDEKKSSFNPLQEFKKPINSMLDADEWENITKSAKEARERDAIAMARKQLTQLYQEAKSHEDNAESAVLTAKDSIDTISYVVLELSKARRIYNQITDLLLAQDVSIDDEKAKVTDIEKKITHWESEKETLEKQEKEKKRQAGLSAELEKRTGDGKSYSIKEFKVCFQRVEKWLKEKGSSQLTSDEQAALENTAKRLLAAPDKKDVRDLKSFSQGKHWKVLTKYLGEERAKILYDEYYKSGSNE